MLQHESDLYPEQRKLRKISEKAAVQGQGHAQQRPRTHTDLTYT